MRLVNKFTYMIDIMQPSHLMEADILMFILPRLWGFHCFFIVFFYKNISHVKHVIKDYLIKLETSTKMIIVSASKTN